MPVRTPQRELEASNLHPHIDLLERLLVDKGLSPKQIAKRWVSLNLTEVEVKNALLQVGLEVEGEVKVPLTRSGVASGATCRLNTRVIRG